MFKGIFMVSYDFVKEQLSNFQRWRIDELFPFIAENIIHVPQLANYALRKACFIGDLPSVCYLLTDAALNRAQANATIYDPKMDNTRENSAFVSACQSGNTQLIDYLLGSPQLIAHADICEKSIYGPYAAFAELAVVGDIKTIEFLLQHEKFPKNEYNSVMDIVVRGLISQSHHHTYSHIVSQFGITINNIDNALDLLLDDYGHSDPLKIPQLPIFPQALILKEMVQTRQLYYELQQHLPLTSDTVRKRKI